ncbi:uncharacterized protein A4U43_C01F29120 [Asparagus officinalis]|uniref:Uncharacterized protein n=2 Tax=Asparagus officinalis TaxID=4686 RepID=A0A5P1FWU4_ASPOF|nr:uncharacterized protein A4U43_C01F29120 [Asparagus officinalis]
MVPSYRGGFMESDYDFYSASNDRSTFCYRSVAIIFTTLLVLRHSLPLMIGEPEEYSVTLFSLHVLRTVGILIPVAVMARFIFIFQRRRHVQEARDVTISGSDEESLSVPSNYRRQRPNLILVR